MSHISLFEKSWIDLVFENRNRSYGAYVLRRDNAKTTLLAFLSGLSLLGILALIPMLLHLLNGNPATETLPDTDVFPMIHVARIQPPVEKEKQILTPAQKSHPAQDITKKQLLDPVITGASQADDIADNHDQPTIIDAPAANTGTVSPTAPATPLPVPVDALPNDNPVPTFAVDKLPEFPGGLKKFYAFVGDNFEKIDVDETVTVLTSFIVETDGSITDIKVLRNPGYGLDKEAIRVLKSLRIKWKPGIKDGHPVRTLYNFPIKVQKARE